MTPPGPSHHGRSRTIVMKQGTSPHSTHFGAAHDSHDSNDRFTNLENQIEQMRGSLMEPLREVKMEVESMWDAIRRDKEANRVKLEEVEAKVSAAVAKSISPTRPDSKEGGKTPRGSLLSSSQQHLKRATNKLALINAFKNKTETVSGSGKLGFGGALAKAAAKHKETGAAPAQKEAEEMKESEGGDAIGELVMVSEVENGVGGGKGGNSRLSILTNAHISALDEGEWNLSSSTPAKSGDEEGGMFNFT